MFRIHFNEKIGRFVIQVLVLGIFWKTIQIARESKDPAKLPRFTFEEHSFRTYAEAIAYVQEIGLNTLYKDRSKNKYHEHMQQDVRIVHSISPGQFIPDAGR